MGIPEFFGFNKNYIEEQKSFKIWKIPFHEYIEDTSAYINFQNNIFRIRQIYKINNMLNEIDEYISWEEIYDLTTYKQVITLQKKKESISLKDIILYFIPVYKLIILFMFGCLNFIVPILTLKDNNIWTIIYFCFFVLYGLNTFRDGNTLKQKKVKFCLLILDIMIIIILGIRYNMVNTSDYITTYIYESLNNQTIKYTQSVSLSPSPSPSPLQFYERNTTAFSDTSYMCISTPSSSNSSTSNSSSSFNQCDSNDMLYIWIILICWVISNTIFCSYIFLSINLNLNNIKETQLELEINQLEKIKYILYLCLEKDIYNNQNGKKVLNEYYFILSKENIDTFLNDYLEVITTQKLKLRKYKHNEWFKEQCLKNFDLKMEINNK